MLISCSIIVMVLCVDSRFDCVEYDTCMCVCLCVDIHVHITILYIYIYVL